MKNFLKGVCVCQLLKLSGCLNPIYNDIPVKTCFKLIPLPKERHDRRIVGFNCALKFATGISEAQALKPHDTGPQQVHASFVSADLFFGKRGDASKEAFAELTPVR